MNIVSAVDSDSLREGMGKVKTTLTQKSVEER